MRHHIKLYLLAAICLIIIGVAFLVWGNTWRMALANHNYNKTDYDRAQERYEDLLVDLPNSPYVLHNLGLSFLKKGRSDKAVSNLREAAGGVDGLAGGKTRKNQIKNEFYYNLGNALYASAEKSEDGQGSGAYEEALENFKQAITANPKDRDAKYNYELTLLRLKQPPQSKPPEQKQNEAQNVMNMNDAQFYLPKKEEQPVAKDW